QFTPANVDDSSRVRGGTGRLLHFLVSGLAGVRTLLFTLSGLVLSGWDGSVSTSFCSIFCAGPQSVGWSSTVSSSFCGRFKPLLMASILSFFSFVGSFFLKTPSEVAVDCLLSVLPPFFLQPSSRAGTEIQTISQASWTSIGGG
ncbi:hypothetical protein PMAYCL1PPCAC_05452, partial [Pristionchus mayeri]